MLNILKTTQIKICLLLLLLCCCYCCCCCCSCCCSCSCCYCCCYCCCCLVVVVAVVVGCLSVAVVGFCCCPTPWPRKPRSTASVGGCQLLECYPPACSLCGSDGTQDGSRVITAHTIMFLVVGFSFGTQVCSCWRFQRLCWKNRFCSLGRTLRAGHKLNLRRQLSKINFWVLG